MRDQDDDDLDPEGPDASEMDDPDEPAVMPCPKCKREIAEDADWCHYCGQFLLERDLEGKSPLIYLGVAAVALIVIVVFILRR